MTWLDTSSMHWVAGHRFPLGDRAARGLMEAGLNPVVLAAVALACLAYVVIYQRYRLGAGVVLAVVVATGASGVLKAVIGQSRPPAAMTLALVQVSGMSLPSTHAALTSAAAMALYLGLTWVSPAQRRLARWVLAAGVLAIGLALVYLGVHWPTDVLTGWVIGATAGAGAAVAVGAAGGALPQALAGAWRSIRRAGPAG